MTENLLPLLKSSTSLARVINIAGGTKEGPIYLDDIQGLNVSLPKIRGHLTSIITLIQEHFAAEAPTVSFIHAFPGAVKTPLFDHVPGFFGGLLRTIMKLSMLVLGSWLWIEPKECGERSVFFSTSGAFPSREATKAASVELVEGLDVKKGVDGEVGSGSYSVDYDGTELAQKTQTMLADYHKKGATDTIWDHLQSEFARITNSTSY